MSVALLVVLILMLGGCVRGFRRGLIREGGGAVRLIFGLMMLSQVLMAVRGYRESRFTDIITAVLIMVALKLVYKVVDFFITGLEILGKLPFINSLDHLAGGVLGVAEALVIVWVLVQFKGLFI